MSKLDFSKKEISDMLDGIFDGSIGVDNLPDDLYLALAAYLKSGLYKGFGGSLADYAPASADFRLLEELRTNVYLFSGAKTYQQMREYVDLLTDSDGKVRPLKDFTEDALVIYDQYNVTWLETERATCIGQAANAVKWNNIVKDKKLFPLIRYSAIEDDNTSDICAPLDGITLPVDDPFWDEFMPENHFNCRCTVEQLEESDAEETPKEDVDNATDNNPITDQFKGNVGKDGMIFKKDSPYFTEIPKEDKTYAKNNFNLPIPDED